MLSMCVKSGVWPGAPHVPLMGHVLLWPATVWLQRLCGDSVCSHGPVCLADMHGVHGAGLPGIELRATNLDILHATIWF